MPTFEMPPLAPPPAPRDAARARLRTRAMLCWAAVLIEYAPMVLGAIAERGPRHGDPQAHMGDVVGMMIFLGAVAVVPAGAVAAIVLACVSHRDPHATTALKRLFAGAGCLAALPLVAIAVLTTMAIVSVRMGR